MADRYADRYFEDVVEGEEIPPVRFPLTIQRLVMEAGANRDFSPLHHNTTYARNAGAPEMFANTSFHMGMWERTVREWAGLGAWIQKIGPFRMGIFNPAGCTVVVSGKVKRKYMDEHGGWVELEMQSAQEKNPAVPTVGPGTALVQLPLRASGRPWAGPR